MGCPTQIKSLGHRALKIRAVKFRPVRHLPAGGFRWGGEGGASGSEMWVWGLAWGSGVWGLWLCGA